MTIDELVLVAAIPCVLPRAARFPRLEAMSEIAALRLDASIFSDWMSVCWLVIAVTGNCAIETARLRMV